MRGISTTFPLAISGNLSQPHRISRIPFLPFCHPFNHPLFHLDFADLGVIVEYPAFRKSVYLFSGRCCLPLRSQLRHEL
jgi:hypothetical protein